MYLKKLIVRILVADLCDDVLAIDRIEDIRVADDVG